MLCYVVFCISNILNRNVLQLEADSTLAIVEVEIIYMTRTKVSLLAKVTMVTSCVCLLTA